MGVRPGVSLIVGGGFHGKSTLLSALAVGCYNHVPGDGREFVVCHPGEGLPQGLPLRCHTCTICFL
jgi:predicted ABC-class ATPase